MTRPSPRVPVALSSTPALMPRSSTLALKLPKSWPSAADAADQAIPDVAIHPVGQRAASIALQATTVLA